MYTYTGYYNREEDGIADLSYPLLINSCGIYRLITVPAISTFRQNGRKDYQLLYVSAGRAFFTFDGNVTEVGAGSLVLYHPGEFQKYTYYREDKTEVYWLHFTGSEVEECLKGLDFERGNICHMGESAEFKELFLSIIRELQLYRPYYEELLHLFLRQLFVLVRRRLLEGSKEQRRLRKEMEQAVGYFNENFNQDIQMEAYAADKHMSISWFIRNFKRYVGMPPLQYLISIRMNRAKELLKGTDNTIGEIGTIVGYENPLYFSRVFKNATGFSPREYRRL